MSRLQRYQKKQFTTKLALYIVILVITLITILFFGFKAVINGAIFMSKFLGGSKQEVIEKKESAFFGKLRIDQVPEATNSASIVLSGNAIDFDLVEFYINDKKVKSLILKDSPVFNEEISELKNGANLIQVVAISEKSGKQKESEKYTVTLISEKPRLEVTTPETEKIKTGTQDYIIRGVTDPDIEIHINRSPAVVDASGNFSYTLRLREGDNNVEISADDIAGNKETLSYTIEYRKDD